MQYLNSKFEILNNFKFPMLKLQNSNPGMTLVSSRFDMRSFGIWDCLAFRYSTLGFNQTGVTK